jgi:hypothetical protein
MATLRVAVRAFVKIPVVGDWNKLEAAIFEEWPLHAAATGINANAKKDHVHLISSKQA